MRKVWTIVLSLMLGLLFVNAAIAEPGNTCGTATTVGASSIYSEQISPAGDTDYYRISVPSTGHITVYTTGSTDTYGYLKNSGCTTIASNDDSGPGLNFQISSYPVSAGTYYVAVRHYSSTGTGSYTLYVNHVPTTCTYVISPPSRSVSSGSGTGSVTVGTSPSSGCPWTATSNASWITITSGSSGTGNGTVYYSYSANPSTAPRTGTLTIRGLTFSLTQEGSIVDPDGNTCPTATSMNVNSSRGGAINYAGDYDYYRISVPYTGTLTVYTTGTTDTYGYLKNSGCTTIASDDDSGAGTNFQILNYTVSAGTYYVAVRHYSSTGTGSYTLYVSHGTSCTYVISPPDASVSSGSGSGSVSVGTMPSVCTWTATSNASWITITSGSSGTGDGTVNYSYSANPSTAPRTGTLTIRGLTFSLTQEGSIVDPDGNTCPTATSMNVNSSRGGAINYAGDYDYFRIYVPSNGTLTVYTTGTMDTYGYLKNLGCTTIASDDDSGPDLNFQISSYPVSGGTYYYVAVRHYSSTGTGSYTLYVTHTPDGGGDPGNTCATATSVAVNSTYAEQISPAGDTDYYRISMPSTGYITVYTTGSTDTYGYLKNSSCTTIASNDDYSGTNFRIQQYVSAGTYYVKVRHYSSTGTGSYILYVVYLSP